MSFLFEYVNSRESLESKLLSSSDFEPVPCHCLTLPFLWLCFYFSPLPLCSTCLFLSAPLTLLPASGMSLTVTLHI